MSRPGVAAKVRAIVEAAEAEGRETVQLPVALARALLGAKVGRKPLTKRQQLYEQRVVLQARLQARALMESEGISRNDAFARAAAEASEKLAKARPDLRGNRQLAPGTIEARMHRLRRWD